MRIIPRNCLSVSLDLLHDQGGYMSLRGSNFKGWLHVLHVAPDGTISNYVPSAPLRHPLFALVGFKAEILPHDTAPAAPVPLRSIVLSAWLLAVGASAWALDRSLRAHLHRLQRSFQRWLR